MLSKYSFNYFIIAEVELVFMFVIINSVFHKVCVLLIFLFFISLFLNFETLFTSKIIHISHVNENTVITIAISNGDFARRNYYYYYFAVHFIDQISFLCSVIVIYSLLIVRLNNTLLMFSSFFYI